MMKAVRFLLFVALSVLMMSCNNSGDKHLSGSLVTNPKSAQNNEGKVPVIQFDKTEFDFGKILQGEVVTYTFHFTNTGNAPLIITSVDKSCGCTVSEYPRQPIEPGKTGEIKITYDSKGHQGFQSKALVVNSNTMPAQTTLRIKADVRTPSQL